MVLAGSALRTHSGCAMCGTDMAYDATHCAVLTCRAQLNAEASPATSLRASYAMSGTDLAYAGPQLATQPHVMVRAPLPATRCLVVDAGGNRLPTISWYPFLSHYERAAQ
eukprot:213581-Rhodomonas_salina.2